MTLPQERTRAVNEMGKAVRELLSFTDRTGENALVPVSKLIDICWWLRHYPTPIEMDFTASKCPELWGDK